MIGSRFLPLLLVLSTVVACDAPATTDQPPVHAAPVATTVGAVWATTTVTVVHNPAVPPVPLVTDVRFASHPDEHYDRIVFDIPGSLPGYSVRYVNQVVGEGTGDPIALPGKYFLLITFHPAQTHRDDGGTTIAGTHSTGLPMIRSYAVAGAYEGYVSIGIGLAARAGFHVGELDGRVYLDVAT